MVVYRSLLHFRMYFQAQYPREEHHDMGDTKATIAF